MGARLRGVVAALLLPCCTALSVRPAVRPVAAVTALRAPVSTMVTPDMLPTSVLASTSGVVAAVSQQQLVLAVRERKTQSMPSHYTHDRAVSSSRNMQTSIHCMIMLQ